MIERFPIMVLLLCLCEKFKEKSYNGKDDVYVCLGKQLSFF